MEALVSDEGRAEGTEEVRLSVRSCKNPRSARRSACTVVRCE